MIFFICHSPSNYSNLSIINIWKKSNAPLSISTHPVIQYLRLQWHSFYGGSSTPFLRHPLLETACLPFLKSLFPLPFFLFYPLLRYFRQFPHPHATPSCPNLTHQPSLIINRFKQISSLITSSTVALYQKLIFDF